MSILRFLVFIPNISYVFESVGPFRQPVIFLTLNSNKLEIGGCSTNLVDLVGAD
jgi:hypothetical protein